MIPNGKTTKLHIIFDGPLFSLYTDDGTKIEGITSIKFDEFTGDKWPCATITINTDCLLPELQYDANRK